ncbi:MBL fold metallo-hydrolase [Rubrobacter xylanophilus]|uniref:MBL fold metallo-hydrolase n=2 Tax=Rubrobacter xylanophilus TaxID=49319 RepID=A0A510HLH1_9ACTN|nr:MBL fold metallo-hydrolase [Rubrobacter xylanophilus]
MTGECTPRGFRKITAPNPSPLTLEGTNTYVFAGTVVDPGPDDEGHLERVASEAPVEVILLTHSHPDHSAGAARLSGLCGAPVLAFGAGLGDGERVGELIALHTPGHSPDHLCFWHPESRTLLSGDLIAGRGSIIIAPPEGDLGSYMASLERVRTLSPARILPGHGPEVAEGTAKVEEYIAHRKERERMVLAALEAGASSLEEVVNLAYPEVTEEMRPYARLSARTHLEHLGRRLP